MSSLEIAARLINDTNMGKGSGIGYQGLAVRNERMRPGPSALFSAQRYKPKLSGGGGGVTGLALGKEKMKVLPLPS